MKNNEQKEIELFKFIDKVKERWQNAINKWHSAEELKDEISKMSIMVLEYIEKKNAIVQNDLNIDKQLYLNFEVFDAEIEDGSE